MFSDNVLPAVLRKLGVLEVVDNDLAQTIANREALPSGKNHLCDSEECCYLTIPFAGEKEVELRLCAVHACKQIVEYVCIVLVMKWR